LQNTINSERVQFVAENITKLCGNVIVARKIGKERDNIRVGTFALFSDILAICRNATKIRVTKMVMKGNCQSRKTDSI
jgi:hypothetical protein